MRHLSTMNQTKELSTIDSPNHLFKRVGRNPVAKQLRKPEFHQRIVPLEKMYKRSTFKKVDLSEYLEADDEV